MKPGPAWNWAAFGLLVLLGVLAIIGGLWVVGVLR